MRRTAAIVAILAVAALLAPAALGHGASVDVTKEEPPYRVTFYTNQVVSAGELWRVVWNVRDIETDSHVEVPEPRLRVVFEDKGGAVVNDTIVPLDQPQQGWVYTDLLMETAGTVFLTILLPEANVTFNQTILTTEEAYGPPPGGGQRTPGAEAFVVAFAVVAVAWGSRRRD